MIPVSASRAAEFRATVRAVMERTSAVVLADFYDATDAVYRSTFAHFAT
jgi:hypothetical protein